MVTHVHAPGVTDSAAGGWTLQWTRTQALSQFTWHCLPDPLLTSQTTRQENTWLLYASIPHPQNEVIMLLISPSSRKMIPVKLSHLEYGRCIIRQYYYYCYFHHWKNLAIIWKLHSLRKYVLSSILWDTEHNSFGLWPKKLIRQFPGKKKGYTLRCSFQ